MYVSVLVYIMYNVSVANDHIQEMEDFFTIECNLTGAQCAKVIGKPIEIGKFKCYQLRTQEK